MYKGGIPFIFGDLSEYRSSHSRHGRRIVQFESRSDESAVPSRGFPLLDGKSHPEGDSLCKQSKAG